MPSFTGEPLKYVTITADTAVSAVPARLHGILLGGITSTATQFTIYDHASAASGNVVAYFQSVSAIPFFFNFDEGVDCKLGIYVDGATWGTNSMSVYYA